PIVARPISQHCGEIIRQKGGFVRRYIRWVFVFTVQFCLVTTPIWASEAAEEAREIPLSLVYWSVNFLILFAVLAYFLRKPAKDFFASRATLLQTNVTQAKELKDHAEQKYAEYETRLKNIEKEMEELVSSLKRDGELEKQRLLQLAREQVAALKSTSEK